MLDVKTIEELKKYFAPRPFIIPEGGSLPSAKELPDFSTAVKDGQNREYFIMLNGKWFRINQLTEVK